MPPSSDQPSSYQHSAVDPALYPQEEAPRKRSPGRKGHGKKGRRHDVVGEDVEEKRSFTRLPPTMTSPPSILSQLRASSSPVPPNGVSLPLLGAWEPTPTPKHNNPNPESTGNWVKNTPHNGSPSYNPSARGSPAGSPPLYQQPIEEFQRGFPQSSPPISPRSAYRRPYHKASDYQSIRDYLGSSPNNTRLPSRHSQGTHLPPLPHHPQAHFYTNPELDFGMPKTNNEDRRTLDGCCCMFDTLPSSSRDAAPISEDALLCGYDHGLDVYRIDKKSFNRIGCLRGLRGSVIGAKILQYQGKFAFKMAQPLVVVVEHGPYVPPRDVSQLEPGSVEEDEFDASRSMLQAMNVVDNSHFQTTVEIYSLRTGQHVANLLRNPKIAVEVGWDGRPNHPQPTGDLSVQSAGDFVVVSSGSSGEIFVFACDPTETVNGLSHWKCIVKTWTRTTQTGSRPNFTPLSESDPASQDIHIRKPHTPILSLSTRWLAFLPPPSSSQTTLHAQLEIGSLSHKIPGLNSHTPPTEPSVTCELDTLGDESLFNRVARDVAQGALKSAQWVAAEGLQAWSNYWSKPDQNRAAGSPPNRNLAAALPAPQNFPPTHAQDTHRDRARGQPTLVSILDLEKLSQTQHQKPSVSLHPLATFPLQLGCGALSFSPNGLNLLTASAKGDVQYVWDLMRIVHGEAARVGDPEASHKAPSVRQVAYFSRMTEAKIVDVIWTRPKGKRFAIVTERGTVHINDLPPSAFQWPPYRRMPPKVTPNNDKSKDDVKGNDVARPQSVGSTFGSALEMFAGRTQTALASMRGRSPSTNSGFSGLAMTAGAGAKGGKAVAAGINRSVSAAAAGTVSTIRHYGENRLALPTSSAPVSSDCARWLSGRSQSYLAVTGGGKVRVYPIKESNSLKGGQRRPSVIAKRPAEFNISQGKASTRQSMSDDVHLKEQPTVSSDSFWLPQSSRPSSSRKSKLDTHPLSYAEIETNAPYQPFHTDRRVNLLVFDDNVTKSDHPSYPVDTTPWTFGGPIPATRLNVGASVSDEDDNDALRPGEMENQIRMEGNVEDGQRVVSTITRRKRTKKGDGNDFAIDQGDFFEDDCEVLDYADQRV